MFFVHIYDYTPHDCGDSEFFLLILLALFNSIINFWLLTPLNLPVGAANDQQNPIAKGIFL